MIHHSCRREWGIYARCHLSGGEIAELISNSSQGPNNTYLINPVEHLWQIQQTRMS